MRLEEKAALEGDGARLAIPLAACGIPDLRCSAMVA